MYISGRPHVDSLDCEFGAEGCNRSVLPDSTALGGCVFGITRSSREHGRRYVAHCKTDSRPGGISRSTDCIRCKIVDREVPDEPP